jgi:hypothetical protein
MPVLSDKQIADNAKWGGWSTKTDIAIAVAIALAESGGRTDAVNDRNTNGSTDYGLWQINSVHGYDPKTLLTATGNASAAFAVYKKQGWQAWSVYNHRTYLVYMPRGNAAVDGTGGPVITGEGQDAGISRLDVLQKQLGFLVDGHNWMRVAMFLAGLFILTVGVFKLTGDGKMSPVSKAGLMAVVTKGRAK